MTDVTKTKNTIGTEFYFGKLDMTGDRFREAYFNNSCYSIKDNTLYKSNIFNTAEKILVNELAYEYIMADKDGIYNYEVLEENAEINIDVYSHSGVLLQNAQIKYNKNSGEEYIKEFYINDGNVYYVVVMPGYESSAGLYVYSLSAKQSTRLKLIKNGEIVRISAYKNVVYYKADFNSEKRMDDSGYYMYSVQNGETALSKDAFIIDPEKGTVWECRYEDRGYFIVPTDIEGNEIFGLPVWGPFSKFPARSGSGYFDGSNFYYAENYYTFASFDKNGSKHIITDEGNLHGNCEEFFVAADFVDVDMDSNGVKRYPHNN